MTDRIEKRDRKQSGRKAAAAPAESFRRPVLTPEQADAVRNAIPSARPKRTFRFHMKLVESDRDRRRIEGYASTRDLDRTGEVVEPGAFAGSLKDFMANPVVTYMHDWSNPVGKVLDARIDEVGLFIRAEVSQTADRVWRLIEEGILRAFSIGYEVVEEKLVDGVNHIFKLRLYEVAIVSIPANQRALFSVSKGLRAGNDLVAGPVAADERARENAPFADGRRFESSDTDAVSENQTHKGGVMTEEKAKPTNELLALVREIKEKVDAGAQRELIDTMIRDALKEQKGAEWRLSTRKGEYSLDAESKRFPRPELTPELESRADDIYIASKLLRRDPRSLKMWGEFAREASELRKAMDAATSEEGLEWIPTGFSRELIRKVKLALKVATLHGRFVMPTNPFKLPIDGADATAYLTAESTSDTATKITASTPGTKNVTFDAVKLACRVLVSTELEEDSVVAILPLLRDKIVQALAEAQENATINGDTAGTHQDSDVTSAADVRKAWDGYRKLALASAKVDCSTFDISNLRAIRAAMGKYGVNPNNLAWIAGISVFNKMLGLEEVVTADKYGSNATILTGELAKLDGIPVIVSEFVREDLNASGAHDGTTTDRTVLPLVYRPAFLYGDRRNITLRVSHELYMETDQDVAIATQRLDFQPVQDAIVEAVVGLGYNIAS